MRKVKTIIDVVDWGLCVGCGACYAICKNKDAVKLINISSEGIRPKFEVDICNNCNECLQTCPGYKIDAKAGDDDLDEKVNHNLLIGASYSIWEGFALDDKIRYNASSGGIISALSAYCIEKEGMAFVAHTGMDPERPWQNKSIISKNRDEIIKNAGSRYASSSPCELLKEIENADRPCVFVGRPCDVAAVSMASRIRPGIKKNLGLVLSFFCAGTPCTDATRELTKKMGIKPERVNHIRYRGKGWPGFFRVQYDNQKKEKKIAYMTSWEEVSKRRPFRCHLCPDGLGELSDITSGDAWNKYSPKNNNPGLSHVLVRSKKGMRIIEKAAKEGYVKLKHSTADEVIEAQGLVKRRTIVFGRQLGLKLLGIPSTQFINFNLFKSWIRTNPIVMIKSVLGTMKRVLIRGKWHKQSPF